MLRGEGEFAAKDFFDVVFRATIILRKSLDLLAGAEALDDNVGADARAVNHRAAEAESRIYNHGSMLSARYVDSGISRQEIELERDAGRVALNTAQVRQEKLLHFHLPVSGQV
jgi:hypothetical protein